MKEGSTLTGLLPHGRSWQTRRTTPVTDSFDSGTTGPQCFTE